MYRRYEDPWKLEEALKEAEDRLKEREAQGCDPEDLIDEYIEVASLKERINFAWQDQAYDESYNDWG